MGLRIGGSEDLGFHRFQELRESALRRMRRGEMEAKVQELIASKRGVEGPRAGTKAAEAAAAGPYARLGELTSPRPDARPHLGQILDVMA